METKAEKKPPETPRQNVAAIESTYQLLLWLIPVLEGFPRSQKFQLADRMQTCALDVLDLLIEAAYSKEKAAHLRRANLALEKLRISVRLSKDLRHLDFKKYEHAARLIDTIGRQVGGWLRSMGNAVRSATTDPIASDGVPAQ